MTGIFHPVSETSVKMSFLDPDKQFPLVVEPIAEGLGLWAWATGHRELIESQVLQYGGLLFRNFNVNGSSDLEALIHSLSGEPLEYRERSSPRRTISGKIYTSTEYPAEQTIALHCENSYQESWPMRIFFHCLTPAAVGGETPIADTRKVLTRIDPEIRQRFINKQVMYVRNFYHFLGLPWQTVFQTADKAEVESYCRENKIEIEWMEGGHLRTSVVREPVLTHPQTGEEVWFNHAMFFHVSTLEPEIQEGLLLAFQEDELPSNSFYGDGTPIEASVVKELRQCHQQEMVLVPWQQGDVLMLDNMLVAHGRLPYSGSRQVLVGMAQLIRRDPEIGSALLSKI
ncbi:TauD/TfdA family dioxygenase [Phormidesmis priestleyi ULC007]|uniref:TauD/TfdA family dioxygenase n=1 Tax=Phormidesmis priestleyi ULC007 TaxID=1920490 RepID=A0A2T1DB36_9CYAN|nr:TauD/TfdA family dioxygenase [Phormidesmis priestleyi]PSB17686.1 TauD/TfdA family dioxygenase [Phormidesmis priestleyi ULC007]